MPVVRLTATNLRSLPAIGGNRTDYRDDLVNGLMLRVSPTGARVWYVFYKRHRRNRRFKLGLLEHLDLAHAREEARRARARIQLGEDLQLQRAESRGASHQTVRALCRRYLEKAGPALADATRVEWERLLDVEVGNLGPRPAAELTRGEIRAHAGRIAERSPYIAGHVFGFLRRVYSWALEQDILAGSPFVGLKPPARPASPHRVLAPTELRAVLLALRDRKGSHPDAVRLLLLTLTRRSMVTGAQRRELQDMKSAAPLWVVPPTRRGTKRRGGHGLPHVVPLSPAAADVVARRLDVVGPREEQLFPARSDARKAKSLTWSSRFMSEFKRDVDVRWASFALELDLDAPDPDTAEVNRIEVERALKTKKVRPMARWTVHHLRHTGATHLREQLGVSEEVVSLILGHSRRSSAAATRIYDRSELLPERRAALVAWASWLAQLAAGVVTTATVLPWTGAAGVPPGRPER